MGASLRYPHLKVQKEIFSAANMRASGGFGMKIQSMVMSGESQMPITGAGGLHPLQRLRFDPSNIQCNLKRAEGGVLLFVCVVPVFCMSFMGRVSA